MKGTDGVGTSLIGKGKGSPCRDHLGQQVHARCRKIAYECPHWIFRVFAGWWCRWILHSQEKRRTQCWSTADGGQDGLCPLGPLWTQVLEPEQLFQGQLHGQQHCMAGALQLSRGLLSVLYLIPRWVINKVLLITMEAVKRSFFFKAPHCSFWHNPALFTAVIKQIAVTEPLG